MIRPVADASCPRRRATAPIIASSGRRPANRRRSGLVARDAQQRRRSGLELGVVDLARLERAQQRQCLGVAAKQLQDRVRLEAFALAERAKAGQMLVVSTPPKSTIRALSRRHVRPSRLRARRLPDGIDRAGVEALVRRQRRRRRAAAGLRADLRRPVEPDLRRRRRRRAPLGAAPAAAGQAAGLRARHGPRAPGDRRAPGHPGPGATGGGPLRGRVGERDPSTSWASSRARSCARSATVDAFRARPSATRSASAWSTRWSRSTSRPRRGRPRRAGEEGGLRRPPAPPLARPVGEVEDARAAAGRRRPRPARRPHPRAGPGDHRPRRLPPGQHDPRARRARSRPSSTGSCARSATRSPTSAC